MQKLHKVRQGRVTNRESKLRRKLLQTSLFKNYCDNMCIAPTFYEVVVSKKALHVINGHILGLGKYLGMKIWIHPCKANI